MSDCPTRDGTCEYSGVENLEAMKHARRYNGFLLSLVRRHACGQDVLDFGAGAGTFALPMRDAGFAVTCIEPDPELAAGLGSQGLAVFPEPSTLPPESLDYIYSLNVLEHIRDDQAAVDALFRLLRPGGCLLLYVPAFGVLFSAMDRRVGHERRYRRGELRDKLAAGGFRITRARYVDSLGFFSALLYRWVGGRSGVISASSVRFYDRFVFPLSRLLDRLVLGSFGKNLLVVARRP